MSGYTELSALLASHPEIAIFRTFGILNTQNLIYLQAELSILEKEWREIGLEDKASTDPARQVYNSDWKKLSGSVTSAEDSLQWEKFLEIRKKLAEYNAALCQQSALQHMTAPAPQDFEVLREWLSRPEHGNNFLTGKTEGVWDVEKGHGDFVSLSVENTEDFFTRQVTKYMPTFHQKLMAHPYPRDTVFEYDQAKLRRVANAFSTVFSSVLPSLSILVLYNVHRTTWRLGLISVFTTLFAATLVLVSRARRVEVFAATTAFAAVQVVFVGGVSGANS